MPERARRRGASLVEMVIAASVALVVLGAGLMLLGAGSDASRSAGGRMALDARMEQALDKITEMLRASSADQLTPGAAAPQSSSWVQLRRATGIAAGELVWSSPERIERLPDPRDPDDGIDNDGDGLVDEGEVVWTRDAGLASEERTVLCRGVPESGAGEIPGNGVDDDGDGLVDEAGLCFALVDGAVVVELTLEIADGTGAVLRRSATRTIRFRNTGP